MATPVVSGAAVLLLQQNPNLTPDQVKARLMKTASKSFPAYSTATDPTTGITYTDYYDIFTIGAGYLDIAAALSSNDLADASAVSPTAVYDPHNTNRLLSYRNQRGVGQQRRLGQLRGVGQQRCMGQLRSLG